MKFQFQRKKLSSGITGFFDMDIKINYKGKSFEINVKKVGTIGKVTGLMFRLRETDNLLFDFRKNGRQAIHSYFVFFPFLAVWLDEKNNVLEYKMVKPFTFHVMPKHKFAKLIEIPVNNRNKNLISRFPSVHGKV